MTEVQVQSFAVCGPIDARCRRHELARLASQYRAELPQLRLEVRRAKRLFARAARGDRYPRWDALLGARIDLAGRQERDHGTSDTGDRAARRSSPLRSPYPTEKTDYRAGYRRAICFYSAWSVGRVWC